MVHWPDNPPVRIERMKNMDRGDACNVSVMSLGSHTGTHMDAPLHFVRDGAGMEKMPLDAVMGPCRVIAIKDRVSIKVAELEKFHIRRGERILIRTVNSARCWKTDRFDEDAVYISTDAAQWLAKRKVMTVGVDYLSVGGYKKNGLECHQALLEAGLWIIEGLDLSRVKPGRYELICLPLKILKGDGAPARAVLRAL